MSTATQSAVDRAAATTARYRAAGEAGAADALDGIFAPDVVLHSPITMRTVFRGPGQLLVVLRAAFASIDEIAYYEDLGDAHTRALFYRARVGRQEVEEATLVRLDDEARITEIRLWFRPLPGLTALMRSIGPKLARETSRPRAAIVAGMTGPLVGATRMGDAAAVKLVRPSS